MQKKGFKTTVWVIWILLLTVFTASDVFAKSAFSVYIDNDSQRLKPNGNTDRHYTHGTKLVYVTQPDWQWLDEFSTWYFGDETKPVETAVGYFLGQDIYTPSHIDDPSSRPSIDRVYAGWLYTGMFAQRATDDMLDHFELSVGVIGPSSLADQAQEKIHKWFHGVRPNGWENQLGDEPAIDITFLRQQRFTEGLLKPTDSTDVIADYGFTVGSVNRFAQAGITGRWGFNLGNTFGPGRLSIPAGVSLLRKDTTSQSGYLFARVGAKAVQYNRFLSGVDAEPFIGELQVGVVYQYKHFDISYSQTHMTQEYEGQTGIDSYGTLAVSWLF